MSLFSFARLRDDVFSRKHEKAEEQEFDRKETVLFSIPSPTTEEISREDRQTTLLPPGFRVQQPRPVCHDRLIRRKKIRAMSLSAALELKSVVRILRSPEDIVTIALEQRRVAGRTGVATRGATGAVVYRPPVY